MEGSWVWDQPELHSKTSAQKYEVGTEGSRRRREGGGDTKTSRSDTKRFSYLSNLRRQRVRENTKSSSASECPGNRCSRWEEPGGTGQWSPPHYGGDLFPWSSSQPLWASVPSHLNTAARVALRWVLPGPPWPLCTAEISDNPQSSYSIGKAAQGAGGKALR